MHTREIAPTEWSSFFDSFSRQHETWLVTLEESPGHGDPRVEANDLPLQGVFCDPHDRTISIVVGQTPERHLTHTIAHPTRVVLEQTPSGADSGVRISREGGRETRVSFRSAVRADEVDGMPLPRR